MSPAAVRLVLFFLVTGSTAGASWFLDAALGPQPRGWTEFAMIGCFAALFLGLAMSFWVSAIGFVRRVSTGSSGQQPMGVLPGQASTVLLVTVRNEDPDRVFGGLLAMYRDLDQLGVANGFEIFVCSDTDDPKLAGRERGWWNRVVRETGTQGRIHYRRRETNTARKSGNVADFTRRWGGRYRYMILLDADSRLSAASIVHMVRRMEGNPRLGLLQAPVYLVDHETLFARLRQFSTRLLAPIQASGMAAWQGSEANYWGHNAIIRMVAFARNCGLPELPGPPPFGGEILSHDFVEAAMMRRAGWEVRLADDLDGSYEEVPPHLDAFASRERRWCRGNLQHIPLILARGLHPVSRVHLAMGVMSYLAAPLWLAFLLLGTSSALNNVSTGVSVTAGFSSPMLLALLALVVGFLLLPRLMGFVLAAMPDSGQPFGSRVRLASGLILECLISALQAPVMMLYHCSFILEAFGGALTDWPEQCRADRCVALREAWCTHWVPMAVSAGCVAVLGLTRPQLLPWLLPALLGPLLVVPLASILASVRVGRALRRLGLLVTPEELSPPAVVCGAGRAEVPEGGGDTVAPGISCKSAL